MKKMIYFILSVMLMTMLLGACGSIDNTGNTGLNNVGNNDSVKGKEGDDTLYTFEAEVIDAKTTLLVTPDEESNEYRSSDRISVGLSEAAKVLDEEGNVVAREELQPGDILRISYNGAIAESYPAQITAESVEVVDHNYLIDGYMALIDDVYQEDPGLNGDITMIAFDTMGWMGLTTIEKEIILAQMKELYELEIITGTFDELSEQGLIDKDNLYFPEGVLIEITEMEINDDEDKMTCDIRKWRSGLGAIGWEAKAKLKDDQWEITRDNMWIS